MFSDDALFCILNACYKRNSICKLISNMYIYQLAGLSLNFKYKIPYKGISSQDLNKFITETITKGYLKEVNDGLELTSLGLSTLESFAGTIEEFEFIDYIQDLCNKLSYDELNFLCITDFVISEVKEKYGVNGLISQENRIRITLKNLSSSANKIPETTNGLS